MNFKPFDWVLQDEFNWGEIHSCKWGDFEFLIQKFNSSFPHETGKPLAVSSCEGQAFLFGNLIQEFGEHSSITALKRNMEKWVVEIIQNTLLNRKCAMNKEANNQDV